MNDESLDSFTSVDATGFVEPKDQDELLTIIGRLGELGLDVTAESIPYRIRDTKGYLLENLLGTGWVVTKQVFRNYLKGSQRGYIRSGNVFDSLDQHYRHQHIKPRTESSVCLCALQGGTVRRRNQKLTYLEPEGLIKAFDEGALAKLHLPFTSYTKNPIPLEQSVVYPILERYVEALRT